MKWEAKPTPVLMTCQAAGCNFPRRLLGRELAGEVARLEDAAFGEDNGLCFLSSCSIDKFLAHA